MEEYKIEIYISRKKELMNMFCVLLLVAVQLFFALTSENGMTDLGKWFDYFLLGVAVLILVIVVGPSINVLTQRGPVFILSAQELKINFAGRVSTYTWDRIKSLNIKRLDKRKYKCRILEIKTESKPFEFMIENLEVSELELRRSFEEYGDESLWH